MGYSAKKACGEHDEKHQEVKDLKSGKKKKKNKQKKKPRA